mmetsp:Transcript_9778/g.23467  ORF Transcript_9778/g.23467 Transcript_9778/m.23467 type:complete len:218 (-) Transcript_9778:14-667(-)
MGTGKRYPLVHLDSHLEAPSIRVREVCPLSWRENAEVRTIPLAQRVVDLREGLCRQGRIRDEGKLIQRICRAEVRAQGIAQELVHRRDQIRAVVARQCRHWHDGGASHLLHALLLFAMHESSVLVGICRVEEGGPDVQVGDLVNGQEEEVDSWWSLLGGAGVGTRTVLEGRGQRQHLRCAEQSRQVHWPTNGPAGHCRTNYVKLDGTPGIHEDPFEP